MPPQPSNSLDKPSKPGTGMEGRILPTPPSSSPSPVLATPTPSPSSQSVTLPEMSRIQRPESADTHASTVPPGSGHEFVSLPLCPTKGTSSSLQPPQPVEPPIEPPAPKVPEEKLRYMTMKSLAGYSSEVGHMWRLTQYETPK